jgi:hypothetical protein
MGDPGYEDWIANLRQGRLYCGDGRSHFLAFSINGRSGGEDDVALAGASTVTVKALIAARLEPTPTPETEAIRNETARWHLERARIGNTRQVAVEVVVNGFAVDRRVIVADGTPRTVNLELKVARSSWVALRIMPSAHTHPIFVRVGGKPIRSSRRSAQWCRACVDKLWAVESPFIRDSERSAAAEAFEHARKTYDQIISECEVA